MVDLILVILGGFLTYEIFVISSRGEFYFGVKTFGLLVLETLGVMCLLVFTTIHTLFSFIEENKKSILGGFGLGYVGGSLLVNIFLDWKHGGGTFTGIEPNVIICLFELLSYLVLTLLGFICLVIDLRNLVKNSS